MICYKDMTFCSFWEKCKKGEDCSRALTQKVEFDAKKFGLGICQFLEKPKCFKEEWVKMKCQDCDYEGEFMIETNSESKYYGIRYCPECLYCPAIAGRSMIRWMEENEMVKEQKKCNFRIKNNYMFSKKQGKYICILKSNGNPIRCDEEKCIFMRLGEWREEWVKMKQIRSWLGNI